MKSKAKDLALRRLGRSEISAAEMVRFLRQKKIDVAVAREVVEEFVAQGYISDQRYAGMVARSQLARGKGPGAVRMKLAQKGVKMQRPQMKELVDSVEGFDEVQAALQVVERRYAQAGTDEKVRARAFQALIRRGFSYDVARAVIEKMKNEN